jgi:hypothetical protein
MDLYAEDENYRRAVDEMAATYICRHCDARARLIPAAGGRRVLDVRHEPGCPDHDDFGDDSAA